MKHGLSTLTILVFAAGCASQAPQAQGVKVSQTTTSEASLAYETQCRADLAKARADLGALEQATGPKTVATVLEPLNALWVLIDRGTNLAGLYRNVHPDAAVRAVAETCEQDFSKLATDLGLSRPIFEAVSALDVSREDAVTQRYAEHVVRDFRRAGVDKDQPTRDRIRVLRDELVKVGQLFDTNIRGDVRSIEITGAAELAGLPQDYIDAHKPGPDGLVRITTDYPDYVPFMTYAKSDARRLELFKAMRTRGYPQNEPTLKDLLAKRYELARLLGYASWADYITEDKMIKSASAAAKFIDRVVQVATPRADRDYVELLAQLKKESPDATEVGDWQKAYLEELVKRTSYSFDSQAARQYFPYDNVKQGILQLTSQMFGVTYARVDVPVWHPSVEAYEVRDGERVIGRFYLDMHPRADKYKHAASFPMVSGVSGRQIPEGALVCNFAGGDDPMALMEHNDVETFFHEFGHLVHHLFAGNQRWVQQSGVATEWDFVEAPSQMLEEWAWDPTSLKSFAKTAKGETVPDTLISKMRGARDFGKGAWTKQQMFYAALSLNYYNRDPEDLDLSATAKEMQAKYSPFRYVPGTYFQDSFGHLEGYTAMYYTYMWSLVIARDLLSPFQHQGLLSPDVAGRYRKLVLEPGGSQDADKLVRDFLGRDYSFEAFSQWLNTGAT